jgi:uridine phosphorylase
MERKGETWENLFLEAFSNNFISRDMREKIPEVVIVGLGLQEGDGKQLLGPLRKVKKVGQFYVGKYKDVPLAVICQSMGSLATEVTLRVLTKTSAKMVVGVGFVGALQPNIKVGSIILPTLAQRGEGTTGYYTSKEVEAVPSPAVLDALEKVLNQKTRFYKGSVFTTAALIKEDEQLISKLNSEGVLGIECETSALFLISKLYGIHSGAVLVATDNPFLKLLWLDPGAGRELKKGFSQTIKAAYDAAEVLITKSSETSTGERRRSFWKK